MSFWERNMPAGMLLRSNWTATQIADPRGNLTLEAYQAATGDRLGTPVARERFVEYGHWYQRQAVPDLDPRKITRVEAVPAGFSLALEDGEVMNARRVIVAGGIGSFTQRPQQFDNLPSSLASHTADNLDLQTFAGKKVLVIGSGQSSLESAALLHEGGAEVEVIGRARRIHWLQGRLSKTLHHKMGKLTRRLLYAPTDVGPAGISQLMARPHMVRLLPRAVQDRLRQRCVRPAGARWLVERLKGVPITLGRNVVSATEVGGRVKVCLDDRSERVVDHVLLGTGYRIDISKYDFLAPELLRSIESFNGFPLLKRGLETSVPGLHMLGAPAVWSFGPLMQFVSGTHFASRAVLRCIAPGTSSQR